MKFLFVLLVGASALWLLVVGIGGLFFVLTDGGGADKVAIWLGITFIPPIILWAVYGAMLWAYSFINDA